MRESLAAYACAAQRHLQGKPWQAIEKFKVDMDAKFVSRPLEVMLSPVSKAAGWASDRMVRKVDEPRFEVGRRCHRWVTEHPARAHELGLTRKSWEQ